MLVGLCDLRALVLIFGLGAITNLFGTLMELVNQITRINYWIAFIYSCIAGIVSWFIIMRYF